VTDPIYDAGALIAAESNDPNVWRYHRAFLERGLDPVVPATVLAQVVRGSRTSPNLRRFLKVRHIASLNEADAERVGALLAASDTTDIVDAHVVARALRAGATAVLSSDRPDLERLAASVNRRLQIIDV
jgi:hypothetical protein